MILGLLLSFIITLFPTLTHAEIEKTSLPDPKTKKKVAVQKVIIKNNIKKKDTVKTKFFMRHYPDTFQIKVNGITLETNQEKEIPISNQCFNVQYSYIWSAPWGKITGTKEVNYKMDTNTQKIELNFTSWDDEYRIKASGAQPTSVKVIESSGNREKPQKSRNKKRAKNITPKQPSLSLSFASTNNPFTKKNSRNLCVS